MKTLVKLFVLASLSTSLSANDMGNLLNPSDAVEGVLGCHDGTVNFVDISHGDINDAGKLPDTLVGQSCLTVLSALSHPPDVEVGPAERPGRHGDRRPQHQHPSSDSRDCLIFDIDSATFFNPNTRTMTLVCDLAADGKLKVAFPSGDFGDAPPAAGTPCVDALFALRTGERRVAPPIAALLNNVGGSQPVIKQSLLFEFGDPALSVRSAPEAQLVCDFSADAGDLIVKSFDALDNAIANSVSAGESCAMARDTVRAAGLVERPPVATAEDELLIYQVSSRRQPGQVQGPSR